MRLLAFRKRLESIEQEKGEVNTDDGVFLLIFFGN